MAVKTFSEATVVRRIDSHTYAADLDENWVIGAVPHGGYVTSLFLRVLQTHFTGTHAKLNQPDTITAHMNFVRRTEIGEATFKVHDIKIGASLSTVQVTLVQGARDRITGIFTNSNLDTQSGPTIKTGWDILPTRKANPTPDQINQMMSQSAEEVNKNPNLPLSRLLINGQNGRSDVRKAILRAKVLVPRGEFKSEHDHVIDQWIGFESGEKMDNIALGYVSDAFPMILNAFRPAKEGKPAKERLFWFPTVLLNLDIRKRIPPAGTSAIYSRVMVKSVKDGRFDVDMVMLDETGDILATSNHVCLILDLSRNLAGRDVKL